MKKIVSALTGLLLTAVISMPVFAAQSDSSVSCSVREKDSNTVRFSVETSGRTTDGLLTITYDSAVLSVEENDVTITNGKNVDLYSVNTDEAGTVKIAYLSETTVEEGELLSVDFAIQAVGADAKLELSGDVSTEDGNHEIDEAVAYTTPGGNSAEGGNQGNTGNENQGNTGNENQGNTDNGNQSDSNNQSGSSDNSENSGNSASTGTSVSTDTLTAAMASGNDVVVDMGKYKWRIKGRTITAANNVDLNVNFDIASAIPTELLNELAHDHEYVTFSLDQFEGDFGFEAELTLNVGTNYQGLYGNLYYYNEKGELVFLNSGIVNANGNIALTLSHASDFVIIFSEEDMSAISNVSMTSAPNTGDSKSMQAAIVLLGLGVIVCGAVVVRKRKIG